MGKNCKNSKKKQLLYNELTRLKKLNEELQNRLAAQSQAARSQTEAVEDAEFTDVGAQQATETVASNVDQENILNRFGNKLGLSSSDITELNKLFENGNKEQQDAVNKAVAKKAIRDRASDDLANIVAAMVGGDYTELVKELFSLEKSDNGKLLDREAAQMRADYLKERGLAYPIF